MTEPYPMHAADLLSARARLNPESVALAEADTGQGYSYAQLNRRANRMANFLKEKCGLHKGDRVSILAYNSVYYLDLLYGLAKIGAIFAPLNWRLTANELAYIVNDCQPKALLYGPELKDVLNELRPRIQVPVYIAIETAELDSDLAERGDLLFDAEAAQVSEEEPQRPSLSGEDPLCILYTSGTTGRPKGAILPHRQILWNCINTVISWGLLASDITPILTPIFHSGGLFAFMTPVLYAGGKVILTRSFEPEESLRLIVNEKCTVILGVPTLFQMWMNSPYFAEADFSHVRFFINGGAPCPPALMHAWRQAKNVVMRQGYGLTEVGVNCFSMTDEESVPKTGSVGKPIFHSQMRLVDPETSQEVGPNQPGELLIAGPHVCTGYWENPEATTQALKDGWFHTGDSARMDEDGFFYIVGRYKDMIKSGGENIYAAEVEAVFREHQAVADAALIGLPHEKWGEVGLMVVVLKPGQAATQAELLEFCRGRLARYKIPKQVVFSNSLPYSPYGKVIKAELRKQYLPTSKNS